jgi:hypothetical protein
MKRVFALLVLLVLLSPYISSCSDSKETAAEATKNVIKYGKEILGGVNQGVDEGRKESVGIDGAVVVTNINELEKNVDIELLLVRSLFNDQKTEIEIGFKNKSDTPIRIANLDDKTTVLLLDTDGYAQELDSGNRHTAELTIPASAGKKHVFLFNIPVSKAKTLRLWNKDYEIKNVPVIKSDDNTEDSNAT